MKVLNLRNNLKTLPERLRITSNMIALGERISWGSDSAIMDDAADAIERLENELLAATLRIENDALVLFETEAALINRLNEVARMTLERDGLKSDLNAAARTAIRQEFEIKELLIDAERYRAVRYQDCEITGVRYAVFDAAIDTAIKETK